MKRQTTIKPVSRKTEQELTERAIQYGAAVIPEPVQSAPLLCHCPDKTCWHGNDYPGAICTQTDAKEYVFIDSDEKRHTLILCGDCVYDFANSL